MLLGTTLSLEDLIVSQLAKKSQATANALLAEIEKKAQRYSIQGLYKELRKLQRKGVVVKRGSEYSLSFSWVLNLAELVDQMYETLTAETSFADILPVEKPKRSFSFTRLSAVDDFWIHAILEMLQHSDGKTLYQWIPHPWFHLIHSQKSWPFHNALKVGGFGIKSIIGGNTWLDNDSKRITTKAVYEFFYSAGPFQDERSHYYSVTDSYLLTVKLDPKTTERIESLYKSVGSFRDFDVFSAVQAISTPGRITVTIERTAAKVKRMWNNFVEYFEVR